MAEAGVEKAGIMDAKLANQGIERRHLCGVQRRNMHGFATDQYVEFVRVEHEFAGPIAIQGLPEIGNIVCGAAVDVDQTPMVLAPMAREPACISREVDGKRYAPARNVRRVGGHERFASMQRMQLLFRKHGVTDAETDLRQA